jgi:hypothetical protein
VEVVDTGADLNAYAKVESRSGCCSSPTASLSVSESGRSTTQSADDDLHRRLADSLRRYNVNEYAASVRLFALNS